MPLDRRETHAGVAAVSSQRPLARDCTRARDDRHRNASGTHDERLASQLCLAAQLLAGIASRIGRERAPPSRRSSPTPLRRGAVGARPDGQPSRSPRRPRRVCVAGAAQRSCGGPLPGRTRDRRTPRCRCCRRRPHRSRRSRCASRRRRPSAPPRTSPAAVSRLIARCRRRAPARGSPPRHASVAHPRLPCRVGLRLASRPASPPSSGPPHPDQHEGALATDETGKPERPRSITTAGNEDSVSAERQGRSKDLQIDFFP
jgi:hypothetical protein